jgi:predicted transcriptional regulator
MSKTNKSRARLAQSHFEGVMDQSYEAMKPYMNIFESETGVLALGLVSCVAIAVVEGAKNTNDLKSIIQLASLMTNIPIDVINVFAKSITAMIEDYQHDQQD